MWGPLIKLSVFVAHILFESMYVMLYDALQWFTIATIFPKNCFFLATAAAAKNKKN